VLLVLLLLLMFLWRVHVGHTAVERRLELVGHVTVTTIDHRQNGIEMV